MTNPTSSTTIRYGIILLAAAILYGISCAPGAVWQDSGLIQYRVWHNDIEGFLGLALAHPLYYLVAIGAKHLPFGGFGHRVNLVSSLAGAITIANLYLLMRLWLGKDFPAIIAAATLALSHTFWWHASLAETYTLWAALFLGELTVLLQYTRTQKVGYLYSLGLLNGLAVAVHMLATIPLACYVILLILLLIRRSIRGRDAAMVVALWVLGALPYEYLIVKNMVQSGDILAMLASAAFGDRWRADVLNTSLSWRLIQENISLLALNFPTPNALLFVTGLYALHKAGWPSTLRAVVLALLLLFFGFAFRYTISDRHAFFIPFYCLVAVVIGWGVHELQSRFPGKTVACVIAALSLLPIPIYATVPQLAQRTYLQIGTRHDIVYRNDYEYFLQPWRTGYRGAERFATEVLTTAEPNAIVCADTTTVAPLLYLQEVKGLRADVKIVTGIARSAGAPSVDEQTIGRLLAQYPVYVVSRQPGYCPAFILDKYPLVQAGILWRVTRTP